MRFSLIAVALGAATCCALASGYDDFANGVNANSRYESVKAIAYFTSALAGRDLASGYLPSAHLGRARAYLRTGKCAEALADLDEALKLRPTSVSGLIMHAAANACLRNNDAAAADFATAVKLRPITPVYEQYGRFQWEIGLFAPAADNYAQAAALSSGTNPHLAYIALWYAITAERAGTLDRDKLADAVSKIDIDGWPGPILDFFRGKATAEKVYAKAADDDAEVAREQKCEADFYLGEWGLDHKDAAGGMKLVRQAFDECPHTFLEYHGAEVELKRQP